MQCLPSDVIAYKHIGCALSFVFMSHWNVGNFDKAHCIDCHQEVAQETVREAVDAGKTCICSSCGGCVKPDIVFFGAPLYI